MLGNIDWLLQEKFHLHPVHASQGQGDSSKRLHGHVLTHSFRTDCIGHANGLYAHFDLRRSIDLVTHACRGISMFTCCVPHCCSSLAKEYVTEGLPHCVVMPLADYVPTTEAVHPTYCLNTREGLR